MKRNSGEHLGLVKKMAGGVGIGQKVTGRSIDEQSTLKPLLALLASGGEGSIAGSLIGAIIMTIIRTGCQLNGWAPWITQAVTGCVIVIAVAVDRLRHSAAN